MAVHKTEDEEDNNKKRKSKQATEMEQTKKHQATSTEYLDRQLKEDFDLSKQMHADDLRALVRHHRVLNGKTKALSEVDEFHVKECIEELKEYYET